MRRDAIVLRTLYRVTAAAGAAAAVAVLAGCGTVHMGAAAIVGSQRISSATLASQVANLEAAYQASNGRIRLQFPKSQMPQQVLAWLVRFQIRERMAERNGVTVTRAASQSERSAIARQAQQNRVTLADLATANGLPPDQLDELGRFQAIQTAILRKLDGGKQPTTNSGLQALSREFDLVQCRAAKSLHIAINPQYGRVDYSQLSIVPATATLSAPEPGQASPSPTASVQATPAC